MANLSWGQKRRLRRRYQRECRAGVKVRVRVLYRLAESDISVDIERSRLRAPSTVSHVAERVRAQGELGLEDGRRFNGGGKISEAVLMRLSELIHVPPQQFGWELPTWTRELLAYQLALDTGVRLSLTTLTGCLRKMGARSRRPKMFVECPWVRRRRNRRLAQIRTVLEERSWGEEEC